MSRYMSTIIAFGVGFLLASNANAEYRQLCTSVPAACQYTGPDAPVLRQNVCWSPTSGAKLKGSAPCPTGSWPYYVDHGQVINVLTGAVQAYIALDDACDVPGLCVAPPQGHTPGWQSAMCCDADYVCVPGASCGGTLWFCHDGVSNEDGTVTCFHAEEI